MDNPFVVREYDSIMCNKDYANDPAYKLMDEKYFLELEEFIKEYNSVQDQEDVLKFMRTGFRRGVGDVVSFNNNVGIIELPSGYQIEVLPKISIVDDENDTQTKDCFLRMLRCLKDFQGKSFTNAMLNSKRMNLYEVFINLYIQETRQLVKRGLKSAYLEREENIHFYKGKLCVNDQIKQNMAHKERFYMRFDEYQVNRAENRLVKATLMKLMSVSRSLENVRSIRQLLSSFELVDKSINYEKDFSEISTGRDSKDYTLLMQWSKIFLLNKSFTTFSGKTTGKALLFPMERVFEAFVAKWIKDCFEENRGVSVSAQENRYSLFDEPTSKFNLRPDIVVRQKNGKTVVMDTKWKILVDDETRNYGISQSDMYQMYAYAKKYNTSDICLIYPYYEGIKDLDGISFKAVDNEDSIVCVRVFLFDLVKYEQSVERLYKTYYSDGEGTVI